MAEHNDVGRIGEDLAAKELRKRGFSIRERNYRLGNIEIDIIAENKTTLVFVEVKTRTTTFANVQPEEFVDDRKKRFMIVAGNGYIRHNHIEKQLRYDIIGILLDRQCHEIKELHYFENAFAPKLRTRNALSFSSEWRWHRKR